MAGSVKKLMVLLCVVGLVGMVAAAPALAGKKKKGSFTAENPVPHPGPDGCLAAPESLSKTTESLKAPFSGLLTVTMENFEGDWDLFVTDADGNELISSVESQLTGAPATEEVSIPLKKGYEFAIVACNWVGGPSADVSWGLAATK